MDTVRLNNGSTELRSLVQMTMLTLTSLYEEQPLAFYELVQICRDPTQQIFSPRLSDELTSLGLLTDGRVHESIRNIVCSAVAGEGVEMRLVSPIATDQ